MKIRFGFVSNSSSSSFCIVGIVSDDSDETCFDKDKLLQYINKCNITVDEDASINEMLCELCCFNGITAHTGISEYSCDDVIIGQRIGLMKDDETLGDFKKKTFELLKAIGYTGEQSKIGIFVDGGYVG